MSLWQRQCVICRRERPVVFARRVAPFGVIAFCARCRGTVLGELLVTSDPHSLSEVFALLRAEDAERRERPEEESTGRTANLPVDRSS
jgi:chorismate-pyruvate lyase